MFCWIITSYWIALPCLSGLSHAHNDNKLGGRCLLLCCSLLPFCSRFLNKLLKICDQSATFIFAVRRQRPPFDFLQLADLRNEVSEEGIGVTAARAEMAIGNGLLPLA